LIIYTDSENKKESEVKFIISDKIENNYIVSCMSNETFEGNL
jgi:hypothetical protein